MSTLQDIRKIERKTGRQTQKNRQTDRQNNMQYDRIAGQLKSPLLFYYFLNFNSVLIVTGLNIIMPLMNAEMLKFPSLCLQYFKTITFVCEIYPEKITSLNPELQKNLVASLELGLTSVGVDTVYTLCCDFIQVRYDRRIGLD